MPLRDLFLSFGGDTCQFFYNVKYHVLTVLHLQEGTRIEGEWAEGVLEGTNIRYYYPDESYVKGEWEEGVMKKALFTSCFDKKEKGNYYLNRYLQRYIY